MPLVTQQRRRRAARSDSEVPVRQLSSRGFPLACRQCAILDQWLQEANCDGDLVARTVQLVGNPDTTTSAHGHHRRRRCCIEARPAATSRAAARTSEGARPSASRMRSASSLAPVESFLSARRRARLRYASGPSHPTSIARPNSASALSGCPSSSRSLPSATSTAPSSPCAFSIPPSCRSISLEDLASPPNDGHEPLRCNVAPHRRRSDSY